jgi:drug/metabolite transporter superfamily protein YnfA
MPAETQSPRLCSEKTARALHLTLTVLAFISLLFQLWSWTRSGQADWTRFLAPVGFLIMGAGGVADPALGRRYQVLSFVGTAFIVVSLIMMLRTL